MRLCRNLATFRTRNTIPKSLRHRVVPYKFLTLCTFLFASYNREGKINFNIYIVSPSWEGGAGVGGGGSGIPMGFDISPSNFGQLFQPRAKNSMQTYATLGKFRKMMMMMITLFKSQSL